MLNLIWVHLFITVCFNLPVSLIRLFLFLFRRSFAHYAAPNSITEFVLFKHKYKKRWFLALTVGHQRLCKEANFM